MSRPRAHRCDESVHPAIPSFRRHARLHARALMSDEAKRRVIDYYNQEAAGYIAQYRTRRLDQEFYPANDIRLEIVIARLRALGCRTVLDVGCGSGGPLLRMLAEGFDARGFDFAPAMVDGARHALADAGHDERRV